jgi:hypothetical protein
LLSSKPLVPPFDSLTRSRAMTLAQRARNLTRSLAAHGDTGNKGVGDRTGHGHDISGDGRGDTMGASSCLSLVARA